jgi:parallel beta-helix repeat protein
MQLSSSFTFSRLAFVVLVVFCGQAFASIVAVGTCTPLVHFASIQLAVNSVPASSTIKICPGIYPEQVVINKKITLTGIPDASGSQDAAVILSPTGGLVQNTLDFDHGSIPVAAQLLVQNTVGPVLISNLTVDGAGNGLTCGPDVQGILFQNASGTLNHVSVRNQVPNGIPNGCQVGKSIYVQTATGGFPSTVIVENSSVHNYNKNGITGRDAGTTLTVTGNYVQGSGVVPSGGAAQNGIELGFGATGKITANTVIDNIYGDPTVADSTDILLFDAAGSSGIMVSSNILGNSQIPIALVTTGGLGDGVSVTGNKIFGTSTADGIDVCTNSNTVTGNTIFNSAESGVHLDASCGSTGNSNTVTGNTILESECAGILDDTGTNTTSPDTYYTVPFPVTTSTGSCPFVAGPMRAKTAHKFSPAR